MKLGFHFFIRAACSLTKEESSNARDRRGRARGNKVKRQIYDKRHREHGIENNLIKFIKTENYAFVRYIQCAAGFFFCSFCWMTYDFHVKCACILMQYKM